MWGENNDVVYLTSCGGYGTPHLHKLLTTIGRFESSLNPIKGSKLEEMITGTNELKGCIGQLLILTNLFPIPKYSTFEYICSLNQFL